jgi:vacuolar-type H+-ATPase subunit I/STV1
MIFADSSGGDGPVWVAASVSIIGIGYALFRFIFWLLSKRQNYRQDVRKDENELQRVDDAQKAVRRREEATEAWAVVDRLNTIVEGHAAKIADLEAKHGTAIEIANERTAECRKEHAETQKELGEMRGWAAAVVAWGNSKGLKIPAAPEGK